MPPETTPEPPARSPEHPLRAQLFVTCLVDTLYPQVGEAVVRVLRRAGVQVDFPPDQTCCGQPAFNAGLRDQARSMAIHTLEVLEAAPGPVVIPSGSCAAMIRHGYLELFASEPEWLARTRALSTRVYEFTQFLVDVLDFTDPGASYPGPLAYHASCHLLRELGVDRQPRLLLASLRGVELLELPGAQECCGFGGVFSAEHPELSNALLDRKIQNLRSLGGEAGRVPALVACDAGCITQINGGLRRRGLAPQAVHIAELLDHIAP